MTAAPAASRDRPEAAPAHGALLTVRDLAVSFDAGAGERVTAVDGLSLTIHDGQTLALVGESGCGKSVSALSVLRLLACPPARIDGGSVHYCGRDLLALPEKAMLAVRGAEIGMIFQEPVSSLNPVLSIGDQITETVRRHRRIRRAAARDHAIDRLRQVGLPRPLSMLDAYPHELSGGMCQRVMIALALAGGPRLLIADEPTTALDVTIQAQILDLLGALQQQTRMAILLITHDLGVVAQHADVVCVMYAGRVVEYAGVRDLFERPGHPYTRGLFSAIPRLDERRQRLRTVDELITDRREFTRLPGHQYGVVPWWPASTPPEGMAVDAADAKASCLHQIAPLHWVACWRTEYVADHPQRPPDVPAVP